MIINKRRILTLSRNNLYATYPKLTSEGTLATISKKKERKKGCTRKTAATEMDHGRVEYAGVKMNGARYYRQHRCALGPARSSIQSSWWLGRGRRAQPRTLVNRIRRPIIDNAANAITTPGIKKYAERGGTGAVALHTIGAQGQAGIEVNAGGTNVSASQMSRIVRARHVFFFLRISEH